MSIHIGAQKGDIADTVLLPGDPLRAKYIAENFLEEWLVIMKFEECMGILEHIKERKYLFREQGWEYHPFLFTSMN